MTLGDLYLFEIDGEQYGNRDIGEDWEHMVAIEKHVAVVEGQAYPVCIAGKRNRPPEDCGGVWGYQELLAIPANLDHPEHAEQIDWIGGEFDPDAFGLELANTMLAARFKKNSYRPPSRPTAKHGDVSNYK